MASNRKRHGIWAPEERWKLLGELLEAWRRIELGYQHRPAFARDRLPRTPDGNENVRLVQDIENNLRPNTYPAGKLREIARYYGVAYESILAVLNGDADALAPASPPGAVVLLPPITDPSRVASARPYADAIHRRLRDLAGRGIADPDGRQVFGPGPDAQTWDGIGARLDLDDRVWFIADLQHRADGRRSVPGEPGVTPS